ncbi:hypothetical protein HDE_11407 [Halotydeus destructor]|nr:hypothetical protein HDE_11407 [Halotydeus destructor]
MVTSNGQASRRNLNGGDYNGMAKMPLKGLMVGHDQESRNKELELNMGRSVYIRSMYLRVAADREVKSIEKEGLMQINHLWTYNKKLLERNLNVKKQNSEMSKMLETLKTLTAYEDLLNKYEAVQAEVASAFVSVSRELMAGSSRLRIVGIPEEQRERLKDLLRNSPKLTKQNREKYEQISALAYQMSQLSAHLKGTMSLSGNCERMVSSIEESNKKLETFRKVQRSIQE